MTGVFVYYAACRLPPQSSRFDSGAMVLPYTQHGASNMSTHDNENENHLCINKKKERYDALSCYKINYEVRLDFLSNI